MSALHLRAVLTVLVAAACSSVPVPTASPRPSPSPTAGVSLTSPDATAATNGAVALEVRANFAPDFECRSFGGCAFFVDVDAASGGPGARLELGLFPETVWLAPGAYRIRVRVDAVSDDRAAGQPPETGPTQQRCAADVNLEDGRQWASVMFGGGDECRVELFPRR